MFVIPGISGTLYFTALSNIQLRNYTARDIESPEDKGKDRMNAADVSNINILVTRMTIINRTTTPHSARRKYGQQTPLLF
jgi:hypothetical protein